MGRLPPSVENIRRATDVRLDFHVPLFPLGQTARLLELYKEAEDLAHRLEDMSRLGRITYRLGAYCWVGADYAQGVSYARRAIQIADARGDRELRVAAAHVLGMNYEAPGDYRAAIRELLSIVEGPDVDLAKTRRGVTIPTYTAGCAWLAACYAELGDFQRALEWGDRAVDVAGTSQHALAEVLAYTLRAYSPLYRGNFADAVPWCERAVALCDDKGIHGWRAAAYSTYGYALAGAGRQQEGLSYLERGVTLNEQTGIKTQHAHWVARRAEGLFMSGLIAEASDAAQQALSLSLSHRERGNEARALYVLAEAAAAREHPARNAAFRDYDRAIEVSAALAMRPLHARCLLGRGRLSRQTGDRKQARAALETARTMLTDMEMSRWAQAADAELEDLVRP